MADQVLTDAQWYHGLLPREDIKVLLRENGDFIVRMSEPKDPGRREFVLSVKHFVINRSLAGKFSVEREQFDSVNDLVKFFMDTQRSITQARNVIIKRPVQRQKWQLDHVDIELTKKLGAGAFGDVHKGTLRLKPREDYSHERLKKGPKTVAPRKIVDVAIKLAKLDNLTKEQIKEIMREARLMRDFNHPNVVKLYGVAATSEPLMLVMELASNGALDSYLSKNECPVDKKVEMSLQAAWGIEYLHSKNVLHRDIASRNCLYGDEKVKISDFGLSRIGATYQMNPKNRVPIRWLAPETLKTACYSQKTDVWAYGIMCWEIFHKGAEPYPGMMVAEVNAKVKEGYRMPVNDCGMPEYLQALISTKCWADNPADRPTMSVICGAMESVTRLPRPDLNISKAKRP